MIGPELAQFLQEGLSIHLGTRDEGLRPHGARAVAATVEPGGAHLIVYISTIAVARLLPDLRSNGQAAVVFGRPTDDRACQVKGEFVDVCEATDAERAVIETQWDGLLQQFERIGIPRAIPARWVWWPAVGIRLRVTALFNQTPGPGAGAPLA